MVLLLYGPPYLCPSEGHKHGVSIQSPLSLGDTLLQITREWKTAKTWFLAMLLIYQSSIVFQILDFIHWTVTIFSFDHMTGENQEYTCSSPTSTDNPTFFFSHCNELIINLARGKTNLISVAENWINRENSRYTVVFSILPFGNHVNKFGWRLNKEFSFLSKSNLKMIICVRHNALTLFKCVFPWVFFNAKMGHFQCLTAP